MRLNNEHTTRIRAELRNRTTEHGGPAYSPASINKHLVALRQVLRECWRLGLMSAEDYQRAADLKSVEGSRLPRGHHLPGDALGAVLAVCEADTSPAGARDGALLAVLYTTGARRAEIAGLALADYDPSERSLRVRGKRGKERLVYVTVEAAARLDAWIAVRGRTPGALFPPISRGGRCRGGDGRLAHPTGQAIAGILTRRLEQADVAPHTPHDFRRTFIGELLDAGVDLATAQQLRGAADHDPRRELVGVAGDPVRTRRPGAQQRRRSLPRAGEPASDHRFDRRGQGSSLAERRNGHLSGANRTGLPHHHPRARGSPP